MNVRGYQRALRSVAVPSIILLGSMTLSGCGASRSMMRYGSLESRTEMSESVFLELRSELPKTVFISEESTAGGHFSVQPALQQDLARSGYTVVDTPGAATYVIQVNHLRLVEDELGPEETINDAVASAFAATVASATVADLLGASGRVAAGVGLAVGTLGFILDAKTKHLAHTLTTDVRVTETVLAPDSETEFRVHQTRIVSAASKVNLRLADALPSMINGLSTSLSGMLPSAAIRQ